MSENSVQKCRTCLKSSTTTFPLAKQALGCNPKTTYSALLKEYAKLECPADYERLMPQYLCVLCCRGLRNAYAFIKQAQYCNNKLINVISKQLNCLQEKIIDLPEISNVVEKSLEKQIAKDTDDQQQEQYLTTEEHWHSQANESKYFGQGLSKQQYSVTPMDEADLKTTIVKSKEPNDNKTAEHNDDSEKVETIDDDQNDSMDIILECSSPLRSNEIEEMYTETPETNTVCPICEKNVGRRDNLIKHMRTQHDIVDPNKLLDKTQSDAKYNNKHMYLYHLRHKHKVHEKSNKDKTKDKTIKCRSCDYTARTYAAMNYHTRSKHGTDKDKFKCKFCSHMSLKKFDLLTHVKNCHKELIKTLKAESKDDQGEILNDDATTATLPLSQEEASLGENEGSSTDGDDDDDVPLKKPSTSNLNSKTDEDKEQHSDEEFIRKILNIKRRQTKPSSKSFARRCDECGNIYKNYKALYAHQKHVHISEDKYSLCPHCGKKYKRRTDLRLHIEKAHSQKNSNKVVKQPTKAREKRFMCTECSYVCATITVLNIHINRNHTGEKPYKCDICFKSFVVPFDLKTHRYIHTGERPYKCPICSKGFGDNSNMLKHKRTHSGERRYKCKECSKSYTQAYNLSVHKRTHLIEKKLNCVVCGKVFENRSLLNLHRINENHHDE